MTPSRKKLLVIVLALAALIGTGVFALRLIVNPTAFAPVIAGFVERATGLHVSINGGLGLTLYPWLGVEVRGLVISDLPGFPGQPFASVDAADIKVRPMALLRGDLEVEGLRLSGLAVSLIREADGRENWKALPIAKVSVEKDRVVVVKTDGQSSSFRYLVQTAELTGARATFEDRAAKTRFAVTDVNIKATDVRPGQPFAASVSLAATSARPEMTAKVTLSGQSAVDPQAMRFAVSGARLRVEGSAAGLPLASFALEGAGSLDFSAESNSLAGRDLSLSGTVKGGRFPADGLTAKIDASFDMDMGKGTLSCPALAVALPQTGFTAKGALSAANLQAKPRATLSLTVPPFDPKPLLARAGISLPPRADAQTLSKLGLTLQADYLENAEARIEGQLSLDGAPVRITAQSTTTGPLRAAVAVAAATLSLDGYLPPPDSAQAKPAATAETAPPAFPGQGGVIDLRLTAERVNVKKLALTGLDVQASLRQGVAEVSRFRAGLAGGSLSGSLRAETANPARPVAVRLEGSNLAAGTLLSALTGREPLTGTAAVSADLAAQARDENTLLRTLSGKASLSLTNGIILGLNLSPEILSSPMSLLTFGLGGKDDAAKGAPAGTRITSAKLSATIKNGQATTRDLAIQAPPHKVTGQGTVDIPGRTLDMQILAHVAGVADIPVAVTGSLDDPSVRPDLAAIPAAAVTGAAGAALRAVTDPGGAAKGVLDAINPMNLLPLGQKKK
jgi:AsmA protein